MADGSNKPIAYSSRSLSKPEKNYAQIEHEGLAIIFGLNKFHKYIYGRDFVIQTDHKPLLSILKEDKLISHMSSARLQRWALTLSNYQCHLQYKRGESCGNTDGLSRLPIPTPESVVPIPEEFVLAVRLLNDTPISASMIARWTDKDPILSKVRRFVQTDWQDADTATFRPYMNRKKELSVEQGLIMWDTRVIIPPPGRDRLLDQLHEMHPGMVRMKALARSYVWWLGMDGEIEKRVKGCDTCQNHTNKPFYSTPSSMGVAWTAMA